MPGLEPYNQARNGRPPEKRLGLPGLASMGSARKRGQGSSSRLKTRSTAGPERRPIVGQGSLEGPAMRRLWIVLLLLAGGLAAAEPLPGPEVKPAPELPAAFLQDARLGKRLTLKLT